MLLYDNSASVDALLKIAQNEWNCNWELYRFLAGVQLLQFRDDRRVIGDASFGRDVAQHGLCARLFMAVTDRMSNWQMQKMVAMWRINPKYWKQFIFRGLESNHNHDLQRRLHFLLFWTIPRYIGGVLKRNVVDSASLFQLVVCCGLNSWVDKVDAVVYYVLFINLRLINKLVIKLRHEWINEFYWGRHIR